MEGLPIYVLLDTSGSMYGEPIQSLQNGLQVFLAAFRRNINTFGQVKVSLITFGDEAKLIQPLTDIEKITIPKFETFGCSCLGAALELTAQQIEFDNASLIDLNSGKKQWPPIVYIMTDGEPVDEYAYGLLELKKKYISSVVVCIAGQEAKESDPWIANISENIVTLDTADGGQLLSFALDSI